MSAAAVLGLALVLGGVKAQPCRPTVACTAELVPAGNVELEVGALATSPGTAINLLAKVSLRDWLQVQVGTDNFLLATAGEARVVDGVLAALKARLVEQGEVAPTVSLSARVAAPTWAPLPAAQATVDLFFTAHLSKDLGALHVDLNGMLNVPALREVQGQAALALSTALPDGFGVAVEGHSTFGNARLANDGGLRGVLTWSPVDHLVLDVGGDVGFFPRTRAWSLFVGLVLVPTSG